MRISLTTLTLALCIAHGLCAQISPSEVNKSPYTAIYNHLYYLQNDHNYDLQHASLSIPQSLTNRDEIASKLKKILDGKGIYIQLENLPRNEDYQDSTTQAHVYYLDRRHPLIYLQRQDNGDWYYSDNTCQNIDALYAETYPFGAEWSKHFQAPGWQIHLLGVKVWQWLGILFFLVIGFLFFRLITQVINPIISKFVLSRFNFTDKVDDFILSFARLLSLSITVRAFTMVLPLLQIQPKINALIINGLNLLSIFLIIFLIVEIVHIIFSFLYRLADQSANTLDDQLMPVLEKIVMILVWGLGLIYVLDYLNVNVTALLAGISIGGLALALAAQDTVKNLFGSLIIFLDRPFQIGEWIRYGDVDGTVEEVGIRATRLRTFANSIAYVPNAKLADSVVDNMGLRKYRRYRTTIGITYDTPPEKIEAFVEGIKQIIDAHPLSRKDYYEVHLNNFGASALEIMLYMFFDAPDWSHELKGKHEIMVSIIQLAKEHNIEFAFPTQTVHIVSGDADHKPYSA